MRTLLLLFITLTFLACGSAEPKLENKPNSILKPVAKVQKKTPKVFTVKVPHWYKKRTIASLKKYELIGYGQGDTLREAEFTAKESISLSLSSKIDSTFTNKMLSINGVNQEQSESSLKVTSSIHLQDLT
ncbi:hypothetical protein JHD48_00645 [Sulfurimonas sp. SAG-AH-194-I05]|nr:hypothetical protein [Sulfurimonas sp. SAG-AH-194-I05]MDF1874235.1 hypothetical protein [Sulfurimonas sp. SAG-AH-194-I05]